MLAKIKLWVIAALSLLSGVLFALLKVRQSELEVADEKNKVFEENESLAKKAEKAEEVVLKDYWEREEELIDAYNSKFKQAKDVPSRPLSPESLSLLNDSNKERDS